ncbi:hypothetical protein HK105_205171 [Polyrhizophydium stewartii]|uniref:Arrestin C-terminal-like domain-containing protein n=1 Tax=Polyrhizophydium stewartii TaxID=2732419 RepID=A0ABR4N709_9FUNG
MAPPTALRLLPLPGAEGFVHGLYGLEECRVRGFVRIERAQGSQAPLHIKALTLQLRGLLWTRFLDTVDTFDMVRREKTLFVETQPLLQDTVLMPDELSGAVDIPFELAFPPHDPVPSGHGPAPQLLPPACSVFGQSSLLHSYQAAVEYVLSATLAEAAASTAASLAQTPGPSPAPSPAPSAAPSRGRSRTSSMGGAAAASAAAAPGTDGATTRGRAPGGAAADAAPAGPAPARQTAAGPSLGLGLFAAGLASLFAPPVRTVSVSLAPFVTYDPRLLPTVMHPDPRRWRSAPGAAPIEYDIEVGAIALGPNDPIRFAYRMVVDPESARRGVRVRKVSFVLKETHIVGEGRCCALDDRSRHYAVHKPPARVKGVTELLRWEHVEYSPASHSDFSRSLSSAFGLAFGVGSSSSHPSSSSSLAAAAAAAGGGAVGTTSGARSSSLAASAATGSTASPRPSASHGGATSSGTRGFNGGPGPSSGVLELTHLREPQKSIGTLHRPGTRGGAGDGMYVENATILHVPALGGFAPSTAKPIIPDDDHICKKIRPRKALLQVRHSVQVSIEFIGAEKMSIESGVYLLPVGHDECVRVLDEDPEILPNLDYDKIVGIEVWVPEYSERDPFFPDSLVASPMPSHSNTGNSSPQGSLRAPTTSEYESSAASSLDEDSNGDQERRARDEALSAAARSSSSAASDEHSDASSDLDSSESSSPSDDSYVSAVPESPAPRYEDVVLAPPPSRALSSAPSTELLSAALPQDDLLLRARSQARLASRQGEAYVQDASVPVLESRYLSPSTTPAVNLEDMDPLTRFTYEPLSIATLEEAISEAMRDSIVLDIINLDAYHRGRGIRRYTSDEQASEASSPDVPSRDIVDDGPSWLSPRFDPGSAASLIYTPPRIAASASGGSNSRHDNDTRT